MKGLFAVTVVCALIMTPLAWAGQPIDTIGQPTLIRAISLERFPEADLVRIQADGPIARWNDFSFRNPGKIVVLDLYGCEYKGRLAPEAANGQFIRRLRFGLHPGRVRIAANLDGPPDIKPRVRRTQDGIDFYIGPTEPAEEYDRKDGPPQPTRSANGEESAGSAAKEAQLPNPPGQLHSVAVEYRREEALALPPNRNEDDEPLSAASSNKDAQYTPKVLERPKTLDFEGKLWNKLAHDTQQDNRFEDDLANHFKFRFGARYAPFNNLYAVLSVDFDHFAYFNSDDWNTDEDVRFHESYVNYSGSRFNFKAGNQIVRWGKTDGYSPLDNVSPEDLRDGLASRREERKLAIPMVNLELYENTYTLQGIVIPYFVRSELDLFGTDWALFDHLREGIGPFAVSEEDVPKSFSNIEYGLRFSGIVRNTDYAFSYLHARTDIPTLIASGAPLGFPVRFSSIDLRELAGFALAAGETIELQYDRQNIFGVEFETTVHDFGLRGDFAYVYRGSFLRSDLSRIKRPLFQYMVGVDYDGPSNSYFLLQFSQSIIQNYDNDIITSDEIIHAVNGTISKTFLYGKFKPEIRFYYDLTDGTYMVNPKLLIKYWDFFSLEVGMELFGGPTDSLLGLYRNNDQVYTILEIDF